MYNLAFCGGLLCLCGGNSAKPVAVNYANVCDDVCCSLQMKCTEYIV